eukprot:TRINITY_DN96884_c0_g1_i1.p1 TRINITY_DN96884_c0_g1~~TRINITY_DN96884_c0_g1_i1.p1  ORF type:complete len:881 (+),score=143.70 TRINITY_DN96884_c0_g1_i1:50-2692(+)
MADTFEVGDHVEFVSGGRFGRSQKIGPCGQELVVGQVGFIHSVPGVRGELGCTFGDLRVSLDFADVKHTRRPVSETAPTKVKRQSTSVPSLRKISPFQTSVMPMLGRVASPFKSKQEQVRPRTLKPMPETGASLLTPKGNAGRVCRSVSLMRLAAEPSTTKQEADRGESDTSSEKSEASSTSHDRPHPPSFYCPISRQCMHDPVVLTDGHTYERRYIEQWLQHKDTSPVSGAKLSEKIIFPNHALRNAIEEYFEDVLLRHREAIRETTAGLLRRKGRFSSDVSVVNTINSLMQCSVLVNADLSVERVLKRIMDEAKRLLGAEVASVFLVDRENRELYSTVNSTESELRIPFDSGVAGHVAASGEPEIIPDAYADARFNTEVDRATGFKTRNILCVPIRASKAGIIGVAQLINKVYGGVLSSSNEAVSSHQENGLSFTQDDQLFFEVFASQAGSAIVSSGIFQRMPKSQSIENVKPTITTPVRNSQVCCCRVLSKSSSQRFPMAEDNTSSDHCPVKSTGKSLCDAENKAFSELSAVQFSTIEPMLDSAYSSWETDTLTLAEMSGNKPLSVLAFYLLEKNGLVDDFTLDVTKLKRFLAEIEAGYPENQYHNRAHAASVVHVMHTLMLHGKVAELASNAVERIKESKRSRFVMLAGLFAAVIHDFEHDGTSNDFHMKSLTERAITHNNRSVNENHHVAEAFRILLRPECNFLRSMSSEDFHLFRSLVLDLVLATDMAEHKGILDSFTELTASCSPSSAFAPSSAKEAILALKMTLKCSDLGHLTLNWGSHMRWVRRLEEEFFQQGDKEKELHLPVSFLMDRGKPGVSESQMGFFNFVVLPLYRAYLNAFPAAYPLVNSVEANFTKWSAVQLKLDAATAAATAA